MGFRVFIRARPFLFSNTRQTTTTLKQGSLLSWERIRVGHLRPYATGYQHIRSPLAALEAIEQYARKCSVSLSQYSPYGPAVWFPLQSSLAKCCKTKRSKTVAGP